MPRGKKYFQNPSLKSEASKTNSFDSVEHKNVYNNPTMCKSKMNRRNRKEEALVMYTSKQSNLKQIFHQKECIYITRTSVCTGRSMSILVMLSKVNFMFDLADI